MNTNEQAEKKLLDLLAIIHRDGGHYTEEHGLEKSTNDAMLIVADKSGRLEEAEKNCRTLTLHAQNLEKKLAEVDAELDNWKRSHAREVDRSVKFEQQLSRYRWIPTSERMPTKENCDSEGRIWVSDWNTAARPVWAVKLEFLGKSPLVHWMTPIPLPTPTEDKLDAFSVWWEDNKERMGVYSNVRSIAREGFLGGQQSANPS